MISKNQIKLIKSLGQKKFRLEHGLFVAEGDKLINDLMTSYECEAHFQNLDEQQLKQVSFLQHPQGSIALFKIRYHDIKQIRVNPNDLILALDDIQDPGNMGTIIRTADWFGIHTIVCSDHTADIYNPKVVQATMGALARVNVAYTNLAAWLEQLPSATPVYGTQLDGRNIYDTELTHGGIIIMGNEGNGLSEEVRKKVNIPLLIPNYPLGQATSESLNVSIATALVCSEFRRRTAQNPKATD